MSDIVVFYDKKYPPRGAWSVAKTRPSDNYMHGGYTSEKLRRCPVCGRQAVFEEDVRRKTDPCERAKYFFGFCPTCELHTKESGTLKEAVMQWQERKYSYDSWLHCHRPKLDTWGCALLCESLAKSAYNDARFYVDYMMQNSAKQDEALNSARNALNEIETFFVKSPFAFALDPDAVVSKMRQEFFPELTPDERLKIPLKLSQLYKGKEIAKACIAKRNSQKQQ